MRILDTVDDNDAERVGRMVAAGRATKAALRFGIAPNVVLSGIDGAGIAEILARDKTARFDLSGQDADDSIRFQGALSDRNLA